MKIGICDADFISRKNQRFPNLASMKISSFHKNQGHEVELMGSFSDAILYDEIFLSKVFTDTYVPPEMLSMENVHIGGTGFFYDKAPNLPYEIEHSFPDYNLYSQHIGNGNKFKYFTEYSIGFMTRGCIRRCDFCVNKNSRKVDLNSKVEEFLDYGRKKICLLDDNVLASKEWNSIFNELNETGKKFQFKQGLDERLLDEEKCKTIFSSNYDGEFIFAFDNIEDYDTIRDKLEIARKYSDKIFKFYVLCAYDRTGKYDFSFWDNDISDVFRRIELLRAYNCIPYIMRYEKYNQSPFRGMYINIARWANQPSIFKKMSFDSFCSHPDSEGRTRQYYFDWLRDQSYTEEKHLFYEWGE